MNELQVFTNPEFGQVRTLTIEEEPWFVGKDVAVALGYESPRAAVSKKVDPEDKGVSEMETPSGRQQMTIINESGLYALIFGSKLESAKRFKHWVTHDVLPAIRKTGSYSIIPKARASSIDEQTYNKIKLAYNNEKTGKRELFIAQDGVKMNQWGVLQYFEEVQTQTGASAKADALLKLYDQKTRKLTIQNAFGDVRVRAGSAVVVALNLGDIVTNNYMVVNKVTHTFRGDEHMMALDLIGGEFIA